MKKRVLFIGDSNSIHIKRWVEYFNKSNYEVAIATFANKNITDCLTVFYLSQKKINPPGGNYQYLLSIRKLSKIIKNFKPYYINAHFSYSMGLVGLLALKLSGMDAKFSVVCHGTDILDMPHPILYKAINKYVLNKCEQIFSVSSQITEIIQQWNIASNKIWTGQYGVDDSLINIDNNYRDIDIISTRNYFPNSRIDELLESINYPYFFGKKVVFILPYATSNKIKDFQDRYPCFTFFGKINHDQLVGFLKRSKVYISATKSDGASLSLMEAMACGCYPICSNIASNREWIVDSLNGMLFSSFIELHPKIIQALSSEVSEYIALNKKLIFERGLYDIQMKKIEGFLTGEQCENFEIDRD